MPERQHSKSSVLLPNESGQEKPFVLPGMPGTGLPTQDIANPLPTLTRQNIHGKGPGGHTNSSQKGNFGNAMNSFQKFGNAMNSSQNFGKAMNSFQNFGNATNSSQKGNFGNATNSFQKGNFGNATKSSQKGKNMNNTQKGNNKGDKKPLHSKRSGAWNLNNLPPGMSMKDMEALNKTHSMKDMNSQCANRKGNSKSSMNNINSARSSPAVTNEGAISSSTGKGNGSARSSPTVGNGSSKGKGLLLSVSQHVQNSNGRSQSNNKNRGTKYSLFSEQRQSLFSAAVRNSPPGRNSNPSASANSPPVTNNTPRNRSAPAGSGIINLIKVAQEAVVQEKAQNEDAEAADRSAMDNNEGAENLPESDCHSTNDGTVKTSDGDFESANAGDFQSSTECQSGNEVLQESDAISKTVNEIDPVLSVLDDSIIEINNNASEIMSPNQLKHVVDVPKNDDAVDVLANNGLNPSNDTTADAVETDSAALPSKVPENDTADVSPTPSSQSSKQSVSLKGRDHIVKAVKNSGKNGENVLPPPMKKKASVERNINATIEATIDDILGIDPNEATTKMEVDNGATTKMEVDNEATTKMEVDNGATTEMEVDDGATTKMEVDDGATTKMEVDNENTIEEATKTATGKEVSPNRALLPKITNSKRVKPSGVLSVQRVDSSAKDTNTGPTPLIKNSRAKVMREQKQQTTNSPGGMQQANSKRGMQRNNFTGGMQRTSFTGGMQQTNSKGGVQQTNSKGGMQQTNSKGVMQQTNSTGGMQQTNSKGAPHSEGGAQQTNPVGGIVISDAVAEQLKLLAMSSASNSAANSVRNSTRNNSAANSVPNTAWGSATNSKPGSPSLENMGKGDSTSTGKEKIFMPILPGSHGMPILSDAEDDVPAGSAGLSVSSNSFSTANVTIGAGKNHTTMSGKGDWSTDSKGDWTMPCKDSYNMSPMSGTASVQVPMLPPRGSGKRKPIDPKGNQKGMPMQPGKPGDGGMAPGLIVTPDMFNVHNFLQAAEKGMAKGLGIGKTSGLGKGTNPGMKGLLGTKGKQKTQNPVPRAAIIRQRAMDVLNAQKSKAEACKKFDVENEIQFGEDCKSLHVNILSFRQFPTLTIRVQSQKTDYNRALRTNKLGQTVLEADLCKTVQRLLVVSDAAFQQLVEEKQKEHVLKLKEDLIRWKRVQKQQKMEAKQKRELRHILKAEEACKKLKEQIHQMEEEAFKKAAEIRKNEEEEARKKAEEDARRKAIADAEKRLRLDSEGNEIDGEIDLNSPMGSQISGALGRTCSYANSVAVAAIPLFSSVDTIVDDSSAGKTDAKNKALLHLGKTMQKARLKAEKAKIKAERLAAKRAKREARLQAAISDDDDVIVLDDVLSPTTNSCGIPGDGKPQKKDGKRRKQKFSILHPGLEEFGRAFDKRKLCRIVHTSVEFVKFTDLHNLQPENHRRPQGKESVIFDVRLYLNHFPTTAFMERFQRLFPVFSMINYGKWKILDTRLPELPFRWFNNRVVQNSYGRPAELALQDGESNESSVLLNNSKQIDTTYQPAQQYLFTADQDFDPADSDSEETHLAKYCIARVKRICTFFRHHMYDIATRIDLLGRNLRLEAKVRRDAIIDYIAVNNPHMPNSKGVKLEDMMLTDCREKPTLKTTTVMMKTRSDDHNMITHSDNIITNKINKVVILKKGDLIKPPETEYRRLGIDNLAVGKPTPFTTDGVVVGKGRSGSSEKVYYGKGEWEGNPDWNKLGVRPLKKRRRENSKERDERREARQKAIKGTYDHPPVDPAIRLKETAQQVRFPDHGKDIKLLRFLTNNSNHPPTRLKCATEAYARRMARDPVDVFRRKIARKITKEDLDSVVFELPAPIRHLARELFFPNYDYEIRMEEEKARQRGQNGKLSSFPNGLRDLYLEQLECFPYLKTIEQIRREREDLRDKIRGGRGGSTANSVLVTSGLTNDKMLPVLLAGSKNDLKQIDSKSNPSGFKTTSTTKNPNAGYNTLLVNLGSISTSCVKFFEHNRYAVITPKKKGDLVYLAEWLCDRDRLIHIGDGFTPLSTNTQDYYCEFRAFLINYSKFEKALENQKTTIATPYSNHYQEDYYTVPHKFRLERIDRTNGLIVPKPAPPELVKANKENLQLQEQKIKEACFRLKGKGTGKKGIIDWTEIDKQAKALEKGMGENDYKGEGKGELLENQGKGNDTDIVSLVAKGDYYKGEAKGKDATTGLEGTKGKTLVEGIDYILAKGKDGVFFYKGKNGEFKGKKGDFKGYLEGKDSKGKGSTEGSGISSTVDKRTSDVSAMKDWIDHTRNFCEKLGIKPSTSKLAGLVDILPTTTLGVSKVVDKRKVNSTNNSTSYKFESSTGNINPETYKYNRKKRDDSPTNPKNLRKEKEYDPFVPYSPRGSSSNGLRPKEIKIVDSSTDMMKPERLNFHKTTLKFSVKERHKLLKSAATEKRAKSAATTSGRRNKLKSTTRNKSRPKSKERSKSLKEKRSKSLQEKRSKPFKEIADDAEPKGGEGNLKTRVPEKETTKEGKQIIYKDGKEIIYREKGGSEFEKEGAKGTNQAEQQATKNPEPETEQQKILNEQRLSRRLKQRKLAILDRRSIKSNEILPYPMRYPEFYMGVELMNSMQKRVFLEIATPKRDLILKCASTPQHLRQAWSALQFYREGREESVAAKEFLKKNTTALNHNIKQAKQSIMILGRQAVPEVWNSSECFQFQCKKAGISRQIAEIRLEWFQDVLIGKESTGGMIMHRRNTCFRLRCEDKELRGRTKRKVARAALRREARNQATKQFGSSSGNNMQQMSSSMSGENTTGGSIISFLPDSQQKFKTVAEEIKQKGETIGFRSYYVGILCPRCDNVYLNFQKLKKGIEYKLQEGDILDLVAPYKGECGERTILDGDKLACPFPYLSFRYRVSYNGQFPFMTRYTNFSRLESIMGEKSGGILDLRQLNEAKVKKPYSMLKDVRDYYLDGSGMTMDKKFKLNDTNRAKKKKSNNRNIDYYSNDWNNNSNSLNNNNSNSLNNNNSNNNWKSWNSFENDWGDWLHPKRRKVNSPKDGQT